MRFIKVMFTTAVCAMIICGCGKDNYAVAEKTDYSGKYFSENYLQFQEIPDTQLKEILLSPLNEKLKEIWDNNNFCNVSDYRDESKLFPPEGSRLPVITEADTLNIFYQGTDYDLAVETEVEFGDLGVWKIQTSVNIVDGDVIFYDNILFSVSK